MAPCAGNKFSSLSLLRTFNPRSFSTPTDKRKEDKRQRRIAYSTKEQGVLGLPPSALPRELRAGMSLAARFERMVAPEPVPSEPSPTPKPQLALVSPPPPARKSPCKGLALASGRAASPDREGPSSAGFEAILMPDSIQASLCEEGEPSMRFQPLRQATQREGMTEEQKALEAKVLEAQALEEASASEKTLGAKQEPEVDQEEVPMQRESSAAEHAPSSIRPGAPWPSLEIYQELYEDLLNDGSPPDAASPPAELASPLQSVMAVPAEVSRRQVPSKDTVCSAASKNRPWSGQAFRVVLESSCQRAEVAAAWEVDVKSRLRHRARAAYVQDHPPLDLGMKGGSSSSTGRAAPRIMFVEQRPTEQRPTFVPPAARPYTHAPRGKPERPPALPQWPCRRTNPSVLPRATRISSELKPPRANEASSRTGIMARRNSTRSGVRFHAGRKRRISEGNPMLEVNADGTLDFPTAKLGDVLDGLRSPSPPPEEPLSPVSSRSPSRPLSSCQTPSNRPAYRNYNTPSHTLYFEDLPSPRHRKGPGPTPDHSPRHCDLAGALLARQITPPDAENEAEDLDPSEQLLQAHLNKWQDAQEAGLLQHGSHNRGTIEDGLLEDTVELSSLLSQDLPEDHLGQTTSGRFEASRLHNSPCSSVFTEDTVPRRRMPSKENARMPSREIVGATEEADRPLISSVQNSPETSIFGGEDSRKASRDSCFTHALDAQEESPDAVGENDTEAGADRGRDVETEVGFLYSVPSGVEIDELFEASVPVPSRSMRKLSTATEGIESSIDDQDEGFQGHWTSYDEGQEETPQSPLTPISPRPGHRAHAWSLADVVAEGDLQSALRSQADEE
eukprot:gb/GFBE01019743.1/.p1 GENE.gb/GFBE01019743.1/~~gb/GFBE01019743.1/.p1  ORF type:complete len:846 (+),score=134.73 gb/GFBE01019743.1/:1-2538(+)